jgi:hypothetical protein
VHDAVYVARTNGEIDQISPSGAVTPFVTGLPYCQVLNFDRNGNLFVSCRTGMTNQDSVRKITPQGAVSVFASGLNDLSGMTIDSATGNMFVSSESAGKISKITPQGIVTPFATIPEEAEGLAVDSKGNLFVATIDASIYKITPGGASVSQFLHTNIFLFDGLEIDANDNLFTTDPGNVWKVTSAGAISLYAASPSGSPHWTGLVFDSGGDLLVGDLDSFSPGVRQISPAHQVSDFATVRFVLDVATFAPVPEPGCIAIILAGSASLLIRRRQRR